MCEWTGADSGRRGVGENEGAHEQDRLYDCPRGGSVEDTGSHVHQESCKRDEGTHRIYGGRKKRPPYLYGHLPLRFRPLPKGLRRLSRFPSGLHYLRHFRIPESDQDHSQGYGARRKESLQAQRRALEDFHGQEQSRDAFRLQAGPRADGGRRPAPHAEDSGHIF